MQNTTFKLKKKVQLFPQAGGWHYVAVPPSHSHLLAEYAERGLIAVTATVGNSHWQTSLLPKGDGTHFVALPAAVRMAENIARGQEIELLYKLRQRL